MKLNLTNLQPGDVLVCRGRDGYFKWAPIPGLPHLLASRDGTIRTMDRLVGAGGGRRLVLGRVLKQHPLTDGYLSIKAGYSSVPGNIKRVHHLIAMAYHGPRPPGTCVDHINGDKYDNRPQNLRYVTQAVNCLNRREPEPVRTRRGWRSYIKVGGRQIALGPFRAKHQAKRASALVRAGAIASRLNGGRKAKL